MTKYFDPPERRAELVRRIHDYCQRHNPVADEGLVQAQVQQFLAGGLAFEAPVLSRSQALLAQGIKRWNSGGQQGLKVLTALGLCAGLVALVLQAGVDRAERHVAQAQLKQNELRYALQRDQASVGRYTALAQEDRSPVLDAQLRHLQADLDTALPLLTVNLVAPVVLGNRAQMDDRAKRFLDVYGSVRDSLSADFLQFVSLGDYTAANTRLHATLASPAFIQSSVRFAQLGVKAEVATAALHAQADPRPLEALADAIASVPALDALVARVQPALSAFTAMHLKPAEQTRVTAMADQASTAIQALDIDAAQPAVERLTDALAFARQALSIDVVNRAGEQSGARRTWHDTTGNAASEAWYAIVEATDASGQVVRVPVTSSETGKSSMASAFGLRISAELYQKLKDDKLKDGIVNDPHMGDKPANSLSMVFDSKVLATDPDLILSW